MKPHAAFGVSDTPDGRRIPSSRLLAAADILYATGLGRGALPLPGLDQAGAWLLCWSAAGYAPTPNILSDAPARPATAPAFGHRTRARLRSAVHPVVRS